MSLSRAGKLTDDEKRSSVLLRGGRRKAETNLGSAAWKGCATGWGNGLARGARLRGVRIKKSRDDSRLRSLDRLRHGGGLPFTVEVLGEDEGALGEGVGFAQVALGFGVAGEFDQAVDTGDDARSRARSSGGGAPGRPGGGSRGLAFGGGILQLLALGW
jgi:hypothetical protein